MEGLFLCLEERSLSTAQPFRITLEVLEVSCLLKMEESSYQGVTPLRRILLELVDSVKSKGRLSLSTLTPLSSR